MHNPDPENCALCKAHKAALDAGHLEGTPAMHLLRGNIKKHLNGRNHPVDEHTLRKQNLYYILRRMREKGSSKKEIEKMRADFARGW